MLIEKWHNTCFLTTNMMTNFVTSHLKQISKVEQVMQNVLLICFTLIVKQTYSFFSKKPYPLLTTIILSTYTTLLLQISIFDYRQIVNFQYIFWIFG